MCLTPQLVKCRTTLVLWLASRELWVCNDAQVASKSNLFQCYLESRRVLDVPHSAVGEGMSLNLEFTKYFLEFGQNLVDMIRASRDLEVIDMLGHDDH